MRKRSRNMIEQLPDLRTELPVDDAVQDAEFDRGFAHFGRIFRQQAVERGLCPAMVAGPPPKRWRNDGF
jgi:hypothetical protein